MIDNKTIKTCPFCGGGAELREKIKSAGHGESHTRDYVYCEKCGAEGPSIHDINIIDSARRKSIAIDCWNRRTEPMIVAQTENNHVLIEDS
jgi:Lar family restriction alleviation protein